MFAVAVLVGGVSGCCCLRVLMSFVIAIVCDCLCCWCLCVLWMVVFGVVMCVCV